MSRVAVVRTVRGLDRRPGEQGREVKTVAGIVIDNDVPLPRHHGCSVSPAIQALLVLEVGDSFEYTGSVRSAIGSRAVRKTGRKFTARRTQGDKDGSVTETTYRVWRIA